MMAAIKAPKDSQPHRGSPTELTAKKTRAAVTTAGMAHVAALVQLRYLKITYQLHPAARRPIDFDCDLEMERKNVVKHELCKYWLPC